MPESSERLIRCFLSVFPGLSEEDVQNADIAELVDADSLAGVTLVALIGEECGVELDRDKLASLKTFAAVREYVGKMGGA